MGERETGMRREEIADWLEEMAGQLRDGALMVGGETIAVPEEPKVRVKSGKKDGARRLRLDLEWPEKKAASKSKKDKGKRKQSPRPENSAKAHEYENGGSNGNGKSVEKQPTVRDYDSHVLVCKGGDCSKKGGKETKKVLKSELRAEGMNAAVRVDSVECIGLCKQGPNVIVYPEGSWYLGLKESGVPEVVEEHLKHGEPVERLAAERRPRKGSQKKAEH